MGGIGIAITSAKMGVQPILEPNGNRSRSRVINLRRELTLKGLYTPKITKRKGKIPLNLCVTENFELLITQHTFALSVCCQSMST